MTHFETEAQGFRNNILDGQQTPWLLKLATCQRKSQSTWWSQPTTPLGYSFDSTPTIKLQLVLQFFVAILRLTGLLARIGIVTQQNKNIAVLNNLVPKQRIKKSLQSSQVAHQAGANIPVSVAWRRWDYFYSPLDGVQVHRRVTLQHKVCRYPFIHVGGERHCES